MVYHTLDAHYSATCTTDALGETEDENALQKPREFVFECGIVYSTLASEEALYFATPPALVERASFGICCEAELMACNSSEQPSQLLPPPPITESNSFATMEASSRVEHLVKPECPPAIGTSLVQHSMVHKS